MAQGNDARSHWRRLELIQTSDLTAQQKMLLVWLWKYIGQNDCAWPPLADLCRDMTLSERQLRRLCGSLEGILTVTRTGKANLYTVDWDALADRTSTSGLAEQHDTTRPDIYVRSDRTPVSGLDHTRPDASVRSERTSTSGLSLQKDPRRSNIRTPPTPPGEFDLPEDDRAAEPVQPGPLQTPELDGQRTAVDQPDEELLLLSAWEATDGRRRYPRGQLVDLRRRQLIQRLLQPGGWPWQEALARFPLRAFSRDGPDEWLPTIEWFLREGTVEAILEGKYDFTPSRKRGREPPDKMASARALLARRRAEEQRRIAE